MASIEQRPRLDVCPFLVPVVADRLWVYPTSVYCRRPEGTVRVPARRTVLAVCSTPDYVACAGYRATATSRI